MKSEIQSNILTYFVTYRRMESGLSFSGVQYEFQSSEVTSVSLQLVDDFRRIQVFTVQYASLCCNCIHCGESGTLDIQIWW